MMLPILISVSVTPGSYFFWASALLPLTANKAMAVENTATRRATNDISFLPIDEQMNVSVVIETSFGSLPVNTLSQGMSIWTRFALSLACVIEAVLLVLIIERRAKERASAMVFDISPQKVEHELIQLAYL